MPCGYRETGPVDRQGQPESGDDLGIAAAKGRLFESVSGPFSVIGLFLTHGRRF
jgi:hypothetical protein